MKISSFISIACTFLVSYMNLKAQVETIKLENKFDSALEILFCCKK